MTRYLVTLLLVLVLSVLIGEVGGTVHPANAMMNSMFPGPGTPASSGPAVCLADSSAQIARITADGGTVVDPVLLTAFITDSVTNGYCFLLKFAGAAQMAVKKSGTNITKIYDVTGNNNDFSVENGTPQFIAIGKNGKAVIRFDGTNSLSLTMDFSVNKWSNFVVFSPTGVAGYRSILTMGAYDSATTTHTLLGLSGTSTWFWGWGGGSSNYVSTTMTCGTWYITDEIYNGSSLNGWVNGAAMTGNPQADTTSALTSTTPVYFGHYGNNSYYEAADVAFIALAPNSTVFTTAQRQALEAFLNTQFAVY